MINDTLDFPECIEYGGILDDIGMFEVSSYRHMGGSGGQRREEGADQLAGKQTLVLSLLA